MECSLCGLPSVVIKRTSRKMFGGHKGVIFSLRYRLRLTASENQLVDRYKLREQSCAKTAKACRC